MKDKTKAKHKAKAQKDDFDAILAQFDDSEIKTSSPSHGGAKKSSCKKQARALSVEALCGIELQPLDDLTPLEKLQQNPVKLHDRIDEAFIFLLSHVVSAEKKDDYFETLNALYAILSPVANPERMQDILKSAINSNIAILSILKDSAYISSREFIEHFNQTCDYYQSFESKGIFKLSDFAGWTKLTNLRTILSVRGLKLKELTKCKEKINLWQRDNEYYAKFGSTGLLAFTPYENTAMLLFDFLNSKLYLVEKIALAFSAKSKIEIKNIKEKLVGVGTLKDNKQVLEIRGDVNLFSNFFSAVASHNYIELLHQYLIDDEDYEKTDDIFLLILKSKILYSKAETRDFRGASKVFQEIKQMRDNIIRQILDPKPPEEQMLQKVKFSDALRLSYDATSVYYLRIESHDQYIDDLFESLKYVDCECNLILALKILCKIYGSIQHINIVSKSRYILKIQEILYSKITLLSYTTVEFLDKGFIDSLTQEDLNAFNDSILAEEEDVILTPILKGFFTIFQINQYCNSKNFSSDFFSLLDDDNFLTIHKLIYLSKVPRELLDTVYIDKLSDIVIDKKGEANLITLYSFFIDIYFKLCHRFVGTDNANFMKYFIKAKDILSQLNEEFIKVKSTSAFPIDEEYILLSNKIFILLAIRTDESYEENLALYIRYGNNSSIVTLSNVIIYINEVKRILDNTRPCLDEASVDIRHPAIETTHNADELKSEALEEVVTTSVDYASDEKVVQQNDDELNTLSKEYYDSILSQAFKRIEVLRQRKNDFSIETSKNSDITWQYHGKKYIYNGNNENAVKWGNSNYYAVIDLAEKIDANLYLSFKLYLEKSADERKRFDDCGIKPLKKPPEKYFELKIPHHDERLMATHIIKDATSNAKLLIFDKKGNHATVKRWGKESAVDIITSDFVAETSYGEKLGDISIDEALWSIYEQQPDFKAEVSGGAAKACCDEF